MSTAKKTDKPAIEGEAKKGGKKKLILILLPLLLIGGGAGAWFSGVLPKMLGRGGEEHAAASEARGETRAEKAAAAHGESPSASHAATPAVSHGAPAPHGTPAPHGEQKAAVAGKPSEAMFMDLPDIVANLNTGPRRATYLKLKAKFELSKPEDQAVLQAAMPRVLDLFQGYLRELRPEELRGTAGTYRLREELLARTNLAAPSARVVAVLFSEIIVQ
jgi:flagellar FliL protein